MMKLLRSQSQTVLVLILIVIGVSFLFYGNVGNNMLNAGGRGNDFGRIAGQDLSVAELYDAVRTTRDMMIIFGQGDALNQPDGRARLAEEAWRERLLLYEADRLHIQITDQEVLDFIQKQPIFQKDGTYSPDLYQQQMTVLQNRYKITPDSFEQAIRTRQIIQAVKGALFSTVRTSSSDVAGDYQKYYGPATVSVITIDPKAMVGDQKVSPAEIEAEYKAHPDDADYRTAEKRKVDYVLLPLTEQQMKLSDKDKAAAIEALGEKALDFALAFQPDPSTAATHPAAPDFQAEAKKRGYTPVSTDFFTADTPPAGLPPSPAFNNTAFALTKDNPVSKVVELDNGVAVMRLDDIQPSQLKPLDEVRGAIMTKLQAAKATQEAETMAQIDSQVLRGKVAKGEDFKKAAEEMKLNVQTLSQIIPAKSAQADQRTQMIAYALMKLGVGDVSDAVPSGDSSTLLVLHLESRGAADPAGQAEFAARFRARQDEEVQDLVYADWADWMSHQPGTHKPPDLEQFGGVE